MEFSPALLMEFIIVLRITVGTESPVGFHDIAFDGFGCPTGIGFSTYSGRKQGCICSFSFLPFMILSSEFLIRNMMSQT